MNELSEIGLKFTKFAFTITVEIKFMFAQIIIMTQKLVKNENKV